MPLNRYNHYRIDARQEDREMLLNLSYPPDIELYDIRKFPEMEDSTSIFLKNLADTGVVDSTLREEVVSLLSEHGYELEYVGEQYGEVVTENPVFVYKTRISQQIDSIFQNMNDVLSSQQYLPYESHVPLTAWEGEMGRFRVWSNNIETQTGQESLEYRLRDASYITEQINRLLSCLKDYIDDIRHIINGGYDDDDLSLDLSGLDKEIVETLRTDVLGKEIVHIYGAFDEAVGGLNQMSMIIRDREWRRRV